jgi:NADH-quinone oxidoreductase subunit N
MVVFLLSLTGIPPLAGFVGKFLLFGAAINAHFTWLAVIAILNSVMSLAVYLRIVVPMYRQPSEAPTPGYLPWSHTVWVVAFIATLAIGVGAQLLIGRLV